MIDDIDSWVVKGLKLEAFDRNGKEHKIFSIIKIGKSYYGVINETSTEREILELKPSFRQ